MLYAAIEVGGTLRSTDGGEHWENLSHGQYVNDDTVDMHGVLASRWRPGSVYAIGRAGMFHSADGGDHWRPVPLEPLNPKGQVYCRDISEVPGNPRKLWVAAGGGFQSDVGVLLRSRDGGDSWTPVDMGVRPAHTMFALAFDERQPGRMSCATNGGEVYTSLDGGESWEHPPAAAGRDAGLRPGARLSGRTKPAPQRLVECSRPEARSLPNASSARWRGASSSRSGNPRPPPSCSPESGNTNGKQRCPGKPHDHRGRPPLRQGRRDWPVFSRATSGMLQERRAREEATATLEERVAGAITRFTGQWLVYVHIFVYGFWILANLGVVPGVPDPTLLCDLGDGGVEAIFSTFSSSTRKTG